MRVHRRSLVVFGGICLLLGAGVLAGGVLGAPTATPSTGNASTHTLVITAQNGSGTYSVTASDGLRLSNAEQGDYQLRGPRVSGTVGKQGDSKDVIHYTGHIKSFQADDPIQVTLDGRTIAPRVLGGQHLRIARQNNTSQLIDYQVKGTDQASRGENANPNDTATTTTIRGQVRDEADSFYFTGDLSTTDLSVSGPAQVTINGQNASVFLTHAPPTPTATPSPSPTEPSPSAPATASSPTSHSPAPSTHTPTSDGRSGTPTDAGGTSLVDQLRQLVGGLVTGIAALVAVLYLFLGE
jgi:hypothetical protein